MMSVTPWTPCQVHACVLPCVGSLVQRGPYTSVPTFYDRFCLSHRRVWRSTGRVTMLTEKDPLDVELPSLLGARR